MREITDAQYARAIAALAVYAEHSKPYVQRDGWTVIPADVVPPMFEGEQLSTDRVNAFSTHIELYRFAYEKPAKFSAYVSGSKPSAVTTWTGETIAVIIDRSAYHTNNFGGRFRTVWARSDWGLRYIGREWDSHDLVNFRRIK